MEELRIMLQKMQNDMTEMRTQLSAESSDIKSHIDMKFKYIDEKFKNVESRLDNQEKRLYFIEKQIRHRNLIIFGIPESEKSYFELEDIVIKFLSDELNIVCEIRDIESVQRIGKKDKKVRPIRVVFSTFHKKLEILKNKKNIKNKNCYVTEDYPASVLNKRKQLNEQAKLEREKGNRVVIKYDKLIILSNTSDGQRTNYKNKRNRSVSPHTSFRRTKKQCETQNKQSKNTLYQYLNRDEEIPLDSSLSRINLNTGNAL